MATHQIDYNNMFDAHLLQELYDSYDESFELELEEIATAGSSDAEEKAWRRRYFTELLRLQGELVKLQNWVIRTGHRVVVIFEGRDAAGKSGVIKRIMPSVIRL